MDKGRVEDVGPYGARWSNGGDWQDKTMWIDKGPEASLLKRGAATFRLPEDDLLLFPQVSVNSLSDISSAQQCFTARYTLFVGVNITAEEFAQYERDPVGFRPDHVPVLMPYNASEVMRIETVLNPDGSTFHLYIGRGQWMAGFFEDHTVKYSSVMDLHAFPLDAQQLKMKFEIRDFQNSWTSHRPRVAVIPEPYWGAGNCAGFQNVWVPPSGEYIIKSSWIHGETYLPDENSWGEVFQVVITTTRNWRYFFWRVIFVLSLISFTACFTFALDDIGDSLGFMATLFVAVLAFLYTIASFLPAVGYLTLMDEYIFSSLLFVFLVGSSNVALSVYSRRIGFDDPLLWRTTAGFVSVAVWLAGAAYFTLRFLLASRARTAKLRRAERGAIDAANRTEIGPEFII